MTKAVVITFGRMNPPTVGHEYLINYMKDIAEEFDTDLTIFLSHSQDNKKNPLPYDYKLDLCRKAFGNCVIRSPAKDIVEALQELEEKCFTHIILVAGSDQFKSYEKNVKKMNGKEYNFEDIKVLPAPNVRGSGEFLIDAASSTVLREAIKINDRKTVFDLLPTNLQPLSSDISKITFDGLSKV